ncbi:hypothetical protein NVP1262O_24 [Vibrio phage 1.262.O._10N.286.51.A9]|nr:hypothetical protein NVP1262O_24 [Vibrio phage 1.262.O._10N.286.51.A9]
MGGGDQNTTSNSTETYTPYNQEQMSQLLQMGSDWLQGGGIQQGTDYTGDIRAGLDDQMAYYDSIRNGTVNQQALNNAMQASADATQTNFERNIMPSIGTASNLTGTQGSSRRGIAEGLAASDMNSQIAQNNAQMQWQAEQDLMNRQMQAGQAQGNLLQGYKALGDYETQRNNSYLDSLLAYSNIMGGMNMGGTTNVSGTQKTTGG